MGAPFLLSIKTCTASPPCINCIFELYTVNTAVSMKIFLISQEWLSGFEGQIFSEKIACPTWRMEFFWYNTYCCWWVDAFQLLAISCLEHCHGMEKWLSGRRRTIGNRVYVDSVSRVRIPSSPPIETAEFITSSAVSSLFFLLFELRCSKSSKQRFLVSLTGSIPAWCIPPYVLRSHVSSNPWHDHRRLRWRQRSHALIP